MMCASAREAIPQLLDNELDATQRHELERHLHGCINCAEAFQRASDLREKIRGDAPYFAAPPELTARVRKSLRASNTSLPDWWRTAAALAAILVVTVFIWNRQTRLTSDTLANELVTAHIRALQPGHLIDVPSSDRHTVKPWFNGKLDFSPRVEDLAAKGFDLIGGRLDYVHGRGVAALVFQRRQHVINLFVSPGESAEGRIAIHGYNVLEWTDGGTSYWAVSDLNEAELATLKDAYQQR